MYSFGVRFREIARGSMKFREIARVFMKFMSVILMKKIPSITEVSYFIFMYATIYTFGSI